MNREHEIKSKSPKYFSNGYWFWNQRFDEQNWSFPYRTIENMADVFIYILDGDTPICFYRAKAAEFVEVNAEMKWVPLANDKSIGSITNQNVGMISFKLSIFDSEKGDVNWDYIPNWSEVLPDKPIRYPIRCHIFQCKELPPSDDNGTSDPFVKVWSPFDNSTEK